MNILIDGYNLMWAIDLLNPIARLDFNLARTLLIKLIRAYGNRSDDRIILVLDGYKSTFPYTRHSEEGKVEVVVTGKGMSADSWIIDTVSHQGFEGAVVSSDREITDAARSRGASVISAKSFERELLKMLRDNKELADEIYRNKREHSERFRRRRW